MKNEAISTQVRIPAEIHAYMKQEAARMGIAQNAFMVVLLEQGRRMWEAQANLRLEAK